MHLPRKFLFSLLALASFSGAVALSTQIRFQAKASSPTESMEDLLEWEAETLLSEPHYEQQFIRTGPPEMLYNCHGWTFTGGKRTVNDDEVKRLLRRSRYHQVTTPEAGDIVVYYDSQGNLCHSGIVKATGKKGFILVESKWGAAGRFLHLLELPRVQASYVFYRQAEVRRRTLSVRCPTVSE